MTPLLPGTAGEEGVSRVYRTPSETALQTWAARALVDAMQ